MLTFLLHLLPENDHNILREGARPLFKHIQEESAEVDPQPKVDFTLVVDGEEEWKYTWWKGKGIAI